MRRKIFSFWVGLIVVSLWSGASMAENVPLRIDQIYMPWAYSDHQRVQIVLEGTLPSSCESLVAPEISVDHRTNTITVAASGHHSDGECLPFAETFTSTVDVGVLPQGNWNVLVEESGISDAFSVYEASDAGPATPNLALVEGLQIDESQFSSTGQLVAVVNGVFLDSCERLDHIDMEDQGDTIVLIPRLSVGDDQDRCLPALTEFSTRVSLPRLNSYARHLLHVPSRHGDAVSLVFTVPGQ